MKQLDFKKGGGLIPAVIQDDKTDEVLMLGFMNEEALKKTKETSLVHFFSRSKNRLWMKGETSGNTLSVKQIFVDCDNDSILIKAVCNGTSVCHRGNKTCFEVYD